MAKPKLSVTTQATTTVNLSPRLVAQVRAQCVEHAGLAATIKNAKTRQKEIKEFVEDVFVKEGEVDALMDGADVNGIAVKMVCGKRKVFDRKKFASMGGDLALYDACMEEKDNAPYVRIGSEE
jgi:hypothetical protein